MGSFASIKYLAAQRAIDGVKSGRSTSVLEYISGKNYFAAEELLQQREVPEPYHSTLLKAADLFGSIDSLKAARESVHNSRSLAAIRRLESIYEILKLYGVEEYVSFDLGMLSKYHYYTGIIFKAFTYGVGAPIVKGGRYDTLLKQFGKDAPAIGFAMVTDDVLEAVQYQKALHLLAGNADLFQ